MNELLSAGTDASWEQIAPHLDAALGELSEADRDAVLLRYFEHKSAREMAQLLGVSEDAAQKRVSRAVERLRERPDQLRLSGTAGPHEHVGAPAALAGSQPKIHPRETGDESHALEGNGGAGDDTKFSRA